MVAHAPVQCSSSKRRLGAKCSSPQSAPAARCRTHPNAGRDQHCCKSSGTTPDFSRRVNMLVGSRKSFSVNMMSLRPLMVMLCILSMSQRVSGAENFCQKHNPFGCGKQTFNRNWELKKNGGGFLEWLVSSKSVWFSLALLGCILLACFLPGSSQGNIFNGDKGASLLMRIGFLIPALTLFAGSIVVGCMRWKMLQTSEQKVDYETKVKTSAATSNMLLLTTVSIAVAFLYVFIAGFLGPEMEHGMMTYSVLIGLTFAGLIVSISYKESRKVVDYNTPKKDSWESAAAFQTSNQQTEDATVGDSVQVTLPATSTSGQPTQLRRRLSRAMRL